LVASQDLSVAVVIPCFNQKPFVLDAIDSVLRQTVVPTEIIVVDDGSSESIEGLVSRHAGVKLIRQENRGLAGARNRGLKEATSDRIVFLDADDRLLPDAIATGLECFGQSRGAAFVYGAHNVVTADTTRPTYFPVSSHRDLIRCNWVGMIGTAMFDRARLLEIGGFDESLGMCEDWDAYLRLSRKLPFASHDHVVADYVKHEGNASNDLHRLWKWIEVVRARELERGLDSGDELAWREGEAVWERMLGPDPAKERLVGRAVRKVARMLRRWFR
jgi:glycosyltransferase involved in cell wall biosynthesis